MLKDIILTQKSQLAAEGLSDAPKMLVVYKEVEKYWNGNEESEGLKNWKDADGNSPLDDVVIMLCEDNFGNIRSLPVTDKLKNRKGGWGMYYHFDYNGAPRGRKNCCDIGSCTREDLGIPRGERYELCRSIHAEANAIIAASRDQMLDSTLYLCCTDPNTGDVIGGMNCCMMCKRQVINAGISTVIIRDTATEYRIVNVEDWIENDDSLSGNFGY